MKELNNITLENAARMYEVNMICFRCEDGEVKFAGIEGLDNFQEPRKYYWQEDNIDEGAM
jgi:hypothetical protein